MQNGSPDSPVSRSCTVTWKPSCACVTNQWCSLSAPLRSGAVGGEDALRPGRAAFTGRPRSPRPSRSSCRSRRLLGEPGLRDGPSSRLAIAVGGDWKGKISPLFYISGVGLAFVHPALSEGLYVLVALIWLVPDRRIERALERSGEQ